MAFSIYQICLYKFPLEKADYPRPCIIVDIASNGILAVLPLSTKQYNQSQIFKIDREHADFTATGLTETSYVFGSPVLDIAPEKVIKTMGALTGELRSQFEVWIGND